jgi:hypothetical protein
MGEDLVAERRRVMLLTRENQQLREELERARQALTAREGALDPESTPGSAAQCVGQ